MIELNDPDKTISALLKYAKYKLIILISYVIVTNINKIPRYIICKCTKNLHILLQIFLQQKQIVFLLALEFISRNSYPDILYT